MKLSGFAEYVLLCALTSFISACSTSPILKGSPVLHDQGPVKLALNPVMGAVDLTDYRSRAITKTYSNGEISRKISEGVDFTVETKVTHVDHKAKVGTYELTTVAKDGKSDLSDFAMPELSETLQYLITNDARVLQAGDMPKGTIYFVPPISLPKEEVRVGESWPMRAEWLSLKSGIPLKMEIVSILKNIRSCGRAGHCAEIEISGDVTILGANQNPLSSAAQDGQEMNMRFHSLVRGKLLFSISKGTVLYSIMRSDESLSGVKDSVEISSCMVSYITEPKSDNIVSGRVTDCNPTSDIPEL